MALATPGAAGAAAGCVGVQAADPAGYPLLLSTADGQGAYEQLLFRALEPAQRYTDPAAAAAALAAHPWRARETADSPRVGEQGWAIFLGYEYAAAHLPAWAGLPREPGFPLLRLQRVELVARSREAAPPAGREALVAAAAWREEPAAQYLRGCAAIAEYLRAGDVYQVNLSRRWQADYAGDSTPLYARLLASNAAPFACRAWLDGDEILSSSPERLVRVAGGRIHTQPIAGTRPRGADAAADAALAAELQGSAKERAEHVMLVDLERNDLGRICAAGSVRVDGLMRVERYASVQHLVSDVRGRLRPDTGLADVVQAVFPGGTITGCPKVRCMQILAQLEARPRLAYTGSVGYCLDSGLLDLNILIRTLLRRGNALTLDAGAGIVAASQPQAELEETRAKARGVIAALAGTAQ